MKPGHNLIQRPTQLARRDFRSRDQDDLQPQGPRSLQLCLGTTAPCVFGDQQIDAVFAHQRKVARKIERAACDHCMAVRQGQRRLRCVDQPRQKEMLIETGKLVQMLTPDRQKNASGRGAKRQSGFMQIKHLAPVIARLPNPRGTLKRAKVHAFGLGSGDRVPTYLRGERVRRVDDLPDILSPQICAQSINPAKAANTQRDWLRSRVCDPAGIGQNSGQARTCHGLGKRTRLGRAAQNEGFAHG